jgi:quercetin dioxygenase-like cupin family protein
MSRFVVIGSGEDGRSKVVEVRDVGAGMTPRLPGVQWNCVWSTAQQPPEIPGARRGPDDAWLDIQLPSGATRWAIFAFDPGLSTPFHHTATLDYDIVLDGEVTLGLEQGEILLRAGDCVVIPAVMHSWKTDSRGCTISVMYCGLEPPQKSRHLYGGAK